MTEKKKRFLSLSVKPLCVLLLGLVLLVPALEPLFAVAPLSIGMVGAIVGRAFGSMVVIQVLKAIRSMGKK